MNRARWQRAAGALARWVGGGTLTLALTVLAFLVLPLMEQVTKPPEKDLDLREVGTANLPPPPPPPPEEEEPEPEPEEPPPPELAEVAPPLDLAQLEMALNPGLGGDGGPGGDFAVKLPGSGGQRGGADEEADAIFSMADLDQKPRVLFQPAPEYPPELQRRKLSGTAHVLFLVDKSGKVQNAIVQKSTHQAFEQPALKAVRRWRFDPGRRNGQAVQFRMRVPITFMPG